MGLPSIIRFIRTNPGNHGRRFSKTLQALEWQIYKRRMKQPRMIRLANGVRFKAYPECVISSALHYADWPEYHELRYCRRMVKPTDTVIDVGANVGHFSLLLSDVVSPANIICFEPTPVSWQRLKENFILNGWGTENMFNAAVGEIAGTAHFPNTLTPLTTNRRRRGKSDETVEVRQVTLDELAPRFPPDSVGLLKIDVEGDEPKVFAGARTFLRKTQPRLVMFESLSRELNPAISAVLSSCGYCVFQLDDNGFPCMTRADGQNLFARPNKRMRP